MYGFFKSVLKTTKEKHSKALNGKSSCQKKLQQELLEVLTNLSRAYLSKELTDEEYKELSKEFNKISFLNLADQRKGKF